MKEELKKKELSLVELSNERMQVSNDHSKNIALIEQERDFLRRDLNSVRESLAKRESEMSESMRLLREKDDKIKSKRAKKKVMQKELQDLRVQV